MMLIMDIMVFFMLPLLWIFPLLISRDNSSTKYIDIYWLVFQARSIYGWFVRDEPMYMCAYVCVQNLNRSIFKAEMFFARAMYNL